MSTQQLKTETGKTVAMQSIVTGKGTPLVLVPGGLTGWLSWEPHARRLSENRQVVRVQLLSVQYGLEGKPLPSDYSVRLESQALKNALDQLDLHDVLDIVAWSFGAEVTLDFALNNPSRIRSMVLIEPPAYWVLRATGSMDEAAKKNEAVLRTLKDDISEDQLILFAQTVGLVPPGQSPQKLPQWPLWMQHRQSLRNSPAVFDHNDDLSRLRTFQPHVLLVKGTGSAKFLHQIIDVLARELPHAHITEMSAGHAPQIVSMDRFLEEVDQFQKSV